MAIQPEGTATNRAGGAGPRAAGSGVLLLVLGAWAAVVAFIGPYLSFGYTPRPDSTWTWTAARGYLEVAPGAAVFLAGLLLLAAASRLSVVLAGGLAIAGGTWLIIGAPLAAFLGLPLGRPDPLSSPGVQALETLFYFYATGAAILLLAALTVGRATGYRRQHVAAAHDVATAEELFPAADDVAGPEGSYQQPAATPSPRRRRWRLHPLHTRPQH
jgi:hypothetical protein